jgi:hypothetical protein
VQAYQRAIDRQQSQQSHQAPGVTTAAAAEAEAAAAAEGTDAASVSALPAALSTQPAAAAASGPSAVNIEISDCIDMLLDDEMVDAFIRVRACGFTTTPVFPCC